MATLCVICSWERERVDALTCGKAACIAALGEHEREIERTSALPFETPDEGERVCHLCAGNAGHLVVARVVRTGQPVWAHPSCVRLSTPHL